MERTVAFVRGSMWAGENFVDLAHAQRHAEAWCAGRAGLRIHGTTQCRPAELFALEEAPALLPALTAPYTCRRMQSPGSTGTTMSRSTRPCTRCPAA